MKYFIFGTGTYARIYSKYVEKNNIICYLDNDSSKNGCYFNGIKICNPNQVDLNDADYILIFICNYVPIVNWLVEMGVSPDKIRSFRELNDILKCPIEINDGNESINVERFLSMSGKSKKVFLISHDLSRTGVPVAIMHMAELFTEMGIDTVIGSLSGGNLEEELRGKRIKYINNLHVVNDDNEFKKFINCFDIILLGTIAAAIFSKKLLFFKKPIIWWINEKYDNEFKKFRLPNHKSNMFYFADGDNTITVFKKYYPNRSIKLLYYFLPDEELVDCKYKNNDYVQYLFAGYLAKRKGHDILIKAIENIPASYREKMKFIIVGQESKDSFDPATDWKMLVKKIPQIVRLDEVSQYELNKLYASSDVFICPSRDDTIPIVVTQAFQYSIPCIISDQVGQSKYMKDSYGGFVFQNEDYLMLSRYMIEYIDRPDLLSKQGIEGREIFEKYFSKESVKNKLKTEILSIVLE